MNIFKPIHMLVATAMLVGMTQVHIASTDSDHFQYIRYLEQGMVDRQMLPFGVGQRSWYSFQRDLNTSRIDPEHAKTGNELAAFLKLKPCYPTSKTAGM